MIPHNNRRVCPGRYTADTFVWSAIVTMLATLDISSVKDDQGKVISFTPTFITGLLSCDLLGFRVGHPACLAVVSRVLQRFGDGVPEYGALHHLYFILHVHDMPRFPIERLPATTVSSSGTYLVQHQRLTRRL